MAHPARLVDQVLLPVHPGVGRPQADEDLPDHAAGQEVAPPAGEAVAGVDDQARDAEGGDPDVDRLFHPVTVGALVDRQAAAVVHAVPDHRPAVVPAGQDEVELVAPLGTVLGDPDVPGLGVDRQALGVPVPVAPDLGTGAVPPDEGIVGGDPAVVVQADHDAVVVGEVLGRVALQVALGRGLAVAHRDEEVALAVEGETGAVVAPAPRVGLEDLLHVREAVVLEAPAHYGGGGFGAALHRLGIAEVEESVRGEVGMGYHVEEPGLTPGVDLGNPLHRVGEEPPVADDAEPARLLRDQHVAAGQEGDRPGSHEPVHHGDDAEGVVLGRDDRLLCRGGSGGRENAADGKDPHDGAGHRDLLRSVVERPAGARPGASRTLGPRLPPPGSAVERRCGPERGSDAGVTFIRVRRGLHSRSPSSSASPAAWSPQSPR